MDVRELQEFRDVLAVGLREIGMDDSVIRNDIGILNVMGTGIYYRPKGRKVEVIRRFHVTDILTDESAIEEEKLGEASSGNPIELVRILCVNAIKFRLDCAFAEHASKMAA
ncbi:hypothetical protein AD929_12755 [Gluconobacter potus]|uniref:Uncharacterized protein n=1 Tax=Gluconobacter potus TaxID=2724927 RepID=A0A149QSJ7_9PROT|nr:hypothetical protein [Gluconobacter potus]KXV00087.1 hypothetical protein AD929_12755 [Gluconobacter potus]MCE2580212.1 hypothetical protein [Komagataeibacter sp. FNDCR1]